MPRFDYSHVAEAARKFIVALVEADECVGDPGCYRLQSLAIGAGVELYKTLEEISYSCHVRDDLGVTAEAFTGTLDVQASVYLETMKHNLPILLRWVGATYPDGQAPGLPSLPKNCPENAMVEFSAMCRATTNLERIVAATRQRETESTPVPPKPDGEVVKSEIPDYVTLSQAAAMVKKKKRSLEHYKTKGTLPLPVVEGGGGRPDLYDWAEMRFWMADTYGWSLDQLPEVHPDTAAARARSTEDRRKPPRS
jgi:hypothetical protein